MSWPGLNGMIDELNVKYPGWYKKLRRMSYNQVFTIYKREIIDKREVPEPKRCHLVDTYFTYACQTCFATYTTDNPDEVDCRYCGSQHSLLKL